MNKLYKSQIVINNKLQEKFVMKGIFKLKTYRQLMTFKFKIFFVQKSGKKRLEILKKKVFFTVQIQNYSLILAHTQQDLTSFGYLILHKGVIFAFYIYILHYFSKIYTVLICQWWLVLEFLRHYSNN